MNLPLLLTPPQPPQQLELTTTCGPDDQFTLPMEIRWANAIGKLLTSSYTYDIWHMRNADLSFYTKFKVGIGTCTQAPIDADANNIYLCNRSAANTGPLNKCSLTAPFTVVASSVNIPSYRMLDASGDPDYVYVTSNNAADGHGVRKVRKSDMTVVASILSTGAGNGQFNNPLGIKYYGGFVYVCDPGNSRIVVLNASGATLTFDHNSGGWGGSLEDLDTDGINWYVMYTTTVYKTAMDLTTVVTSIASNGYSLCIIPDQGDGNGQTVAVCSNTNSNLKRHKCSDLSLINTVGSSGDGSSSLFDPTFSTSQNTRVQYIFPDENRSYTTALGTSHALSWNGFAGFTYRSAGPHKMLIRVEGGLRLVTEIDCNADSVKTIRDLKNLYKLATFTAYSNGSVLILNLSEFSNIPTVNVANCYAIPGSIASLSRSLVYFDGRNCYLITGSLTDLPSTCQTIIIFGDTLITPASIAHLTAIHDIRIYSMGWLTADVNLVLLSASDAIHANPAVYTYATPALNIGGTNQAPSGNYTDPLVDPGSGNSNSDWLWDAGAGKHKALTGMAAIWIMVHNTGHTWTVTYTGGVKP